MCRSKITLRKFLKLLLEIEFYKIALYVIFLLTGMVDFSIRGCRDAILSVPLFGADFAGNYLLFFLFIPFLNSFLQHLTRRSHTIFLLLVFCVYTLLPAVLPSTMNYVTWFCLLYTIAAYIRLYPNAFTESHRYTLLASVVLLLLACCSIAVQVYRGGNPYRWLADSNQIFALGISVTTFCFFKNLKLGVNPIINTIAASCFGVLLLHDNSAAMRTWLWRDTLNNLYYAATPYFLLHAVLSCLCVYIICTAIDFLRIRLLERPFFRLYDARIAPKTEKLVAYASSLLDKTLEKIR